MKEENGNPLQYSCLENPVDSGAWWAATMGSHRVGHNWSDLACMHALEKERATHSSIPAWRILWTEEPDGLLSIGSHKVGHNWSDLACMHAMEKEMATHSSILTWRIPGTEEPGGLLSMGLHRVGHNWSDLVAALTICQPQLIFWTTLWGCHYCYLHFSELVTLVTSY